MGVRRLVLRGLANVASGCPTKVGLRAGLWVGPGAAPPQFGDPQSVRLLQVQAHGPLLLTAMISGLDDGDHPHSPVALEAMAGLARLANLVELRSALLHVAIRIRPFFDSVGTHPTPPPVGTSFQLTSSQARADAGHTHRSRWSSGQHPSASSGTLTRRATGPARTCSWSRWLGGWLPCCSTCRIRSPAWWT